MNVIGYPFVSHVEQDKRPEIENPKEFLKDRYENQKFGIENLKQGGHFRISGYSYDFTPYLKNYVYKQYGNWSEGYAPNKTLLRKSTYGRIDKIVEL